MSFPLAPRRPRALAAVLLALFASALLAGRARAQLTDILFRPELGLQRVLIVRVVYPDAPVPIISGSEAAAAALELEAQLEAFSYGAVDVQTFVLEGPLQLPKSVACYTAPDHASGIRLRADVRNFILHQYGIDIDGFFRQVIIASDRVWAGAPSVAAMGGSTVLTSNAIPAVWGHELGHTYGWAHANAWVVAPGAPRDDENGPYGQFNDEYGDAFDTMGSDQDWSEWHHFNPWFKHRASWLPASEIVVVDATTPLPATYDLQALEVAPGADPLPTALRIRRNDEKDAWVFFRKDELGDGVMLTWGRVENFLPTHLLDLDEEAGAGTPGNLDDATLRPTDPVFQDSTGFTVECVGLNDPGTRARVRIGGTVPAVDALPAVDVVQPDPTLPQSGTVTYRVTAHDPDVGPANGDGIAQVEMWVYRADDALGGCLIGGGPPCAFSPFAETVPPLTAPPYELAFDTTQVEDGGYALVVRATSSEQGNVRVIQLQHGVDNSGPYPAGCPEECDFSCGD